MTSIDRPSGTRASDDAAPPTTSHHRLLGAFAGSPDFDADEATWDAWAEAIAEAIEAARPDQSAVAGPAKGGQR